MKNILACFLFIFLSFANYGHGHCHKLFGQNHKHHGSGVNHLGSLYVTEKDPRKVWKTVHYQSITALSSGPKKLQKLTMNKDGYVQIPDAGKGTGGIPSLGEVLLVAGDFHPPQGLVPDGQELYLVNENVVRNSQLTTGP